MMWQLYIGLLATLWWKTALSASEPLTPAQLTCPDNCNTAVSVADTKLSSQCYPRNYQDNTICSLSLMPAGTTFTQLTFNSFDVESWHDYLKFKGPENFILFANEMTNRVIMTGYPNTTITSSFHTDSGINFKGYEYTASSVNATTLLKQYESYNTTSSAQIMASPMYVTSADDTLTEMDIMAIYLGNNTNKTLADAWPEYVKLVVMTDSPISISNNSSTGFTINWTAVASTRRHAVSIEDSLKTQYYTKADTSSTSFNAQNLPSGSRFTVTVYFINKHGTEAPVTQSASTLRKDPTRFNVTSLSQTTVSLSWDMINGAKNYTIQLNGTTTKTVEVGTSTTFVSLSSGESYTASITAQYETGVSGTVSTSFQTDPANVTGINVYDEKRDSMRISWIAVKGATKYLVSYRGGGTNDTISLSAGSRNVLISFLTPGTLFKLSVVAEGASGRRSYPEEYDGITSLLTGNETVTQISRTTTSVTVSWTNVTAAKAYFVTRISDGRKVTSEKVEPPKTNLSITGLATGANYRVNVSAQGNSGRNETLASISTTTDTASVTNAKVSEPVLNTSLIITWDNITGATGYSIAHRDETAGTTTGLFDDGRNVSYPPYTATNLLPGKLYRFNITAKFKVGSGPAVSISAWTLPPAVTNFTTSNITTDGFEASWSHIPNASYILTLRFPSGAHIWDNKNALPGQLFYTTRARGKKYVLAVTSENPDRRRSKEVTTTFQTPLAYPEAWTDGVAQKSFALKWKPVVGASRYYTQCSNTNQTVNFNGASNNLVQIVQRNLLPDTTYFCNLTAVSDDDIKSTTLLNVTTAKSVCTATTCLHGGNCSDAGRGEFQCKCTLSYEGKQCENVTNWCRQNHLNCAKDGSAECINDPIKRKGECRCKPGYKGDPKVGCIAYCDSTVIVPANDVELNFVSAYVGTTAYSTESCTDPSGKKRAQGSVLCKASTSSGASFEKVAYSPCTASVSSVVPNTTVSAAVTSDELEKQTAQLQLVTSGTSNKVPTTEVKKVSEFIANVGKTAKEKKGTVSVDVLLNVANTANNLIESKSLSSSSTASPTAAPSVTTTSGTSTTTQSAVDESVKIKKRILESLNTLASNVKIPNNTQKIVIITPTTVVEVVEATPNASSNGVLHFQPVVPAIDDNGSKNVTASKTVQPVQIQVPATVLSNMRKNGNSSVRVSFLLHMTPTLFPDRTRDPAPSPIVAANIGDKEKRIKLSKDSYVKMRFANQLRSGVKSNGSKFSRTVTAYECAYWNVALNAWRTDGCYWDLSNVSNPSGCACDHLTNFAILVSKEPLGPDVPLEIVSIIGLSLSMLGLVLTIIIHAVKEEVRKRRPTLILFHICTNLLISSAIFVAGVNRNEKRIQCIVIATFIHYFYLTSWTWMTVYAYDMYRSLVQVFGVGKSRYMTKCTLFGYGVPLLITIIDVGVTVGYIDPRVKPKGALPRKDNNYAAWDNRTYRESAYVAENMCWVHKFSLSMGFLVPVAIMLVFNVFVYAMVIRTLYQRGQSVQSSAKKTGIKDKIFISITLIASTGIAWVFGYFMLLSTDQTYLNVMSWIFALLNSVQGLVIFLSTCVRNENMRKIWLEPLRKCCSSTGSKASLLSPKSNKFEVNTKSTANESSSFSSSTKNTNVQSHSTKPLTSESAI